MACFCCDTTENFIFSPRYRQQKVDLNTSEKSLVFVKTRHRKFCSYVQLSYKKSSYLRKNTHLRKDVAFLHFRLKESSENMIFPRNGNIRKTNGNMIFSVVFTNFWRKFFFHAVTFISANIKNSNTLSNTID